MKPYTVKTLADYLAMSESYIYKLVEREEISYSRFGSHIRFFQDDVDEFVERNHQCQDESESNHNTSSEYPKAKQTSISSGVNTAVVSDFRQAQRMKNLHNKSLQTS